MVIFRDVDFVFLLEATDLRTKLGLNLGRRLLQFFQRPLAAPSALKDNTQLIVIDIVCVFVIVINLLFIFTRKHI